MSHDQMQPPTRVGNDEGGNKNRTLWLVIGGVAVVAVLAWLAFGFFGVQAAFTDNEVSESGPVFGTSAVTTAPAAAADEGDDAPAATAEPSTSEAASAAPAASEPAQTAPPATEPQIVTEFSGTFQSDGGHSTAGQAVVLGNGTGQRFLRFENFETDNGPDLFVYLLNSETGQEDFVDLGKLKGNIGEQNYEIPADVDLAAYDTVQIWCKRFSTPFGFAPLAAQ